MIATAYDKARWYVKRLSVMGGAELGHRVGEWWRLRAMARAYRQGIPFTCSPRPDEIGFCRSRSRVLPDLSWEFEPGEAAAEALLSGHWPALGFAWRWHDDSAWHVAPDTGKEWPRIFFGKIGHREGNPCGDARVVWEPARLQQLVSLALLAAHDENLAPRAAALLETILDSWVRANPPLTGIHYVSAMECALRVIAACHALDLARDRLMAPGQTWRNLLALVSSHAPLIAQRPSLYSSAGNHTIAEGAGLVYVGTLFPELPHAVRWRAQGLRILQREAARQVLPDGGGIEQAFWYLLFIVDLLGLVQALLVHRRHPVPRAVSEAVCRGRRFLNAMADGPDRLPRVGDCDDGYALSRHLRISWNEPAPAPGSATFPNAGYTVVAGSGDRPVRLIFDHGPLGMPPACGHGHADALSIHLTLGGRPLLIDPGTYAYTGERAWRRWFRSTAAHNTIRIDGRDQARQETSFQWSKPFRADLVKSVRDSDGKIWLLGYHDGYRRLNVIHWRALVIEDTDRVLIWDYLDGQGEHSAELNWHLGARPVRFGALFKMAAGGVTMGLEVQGGSIVEQWGESQPIGGWQSRRYGVLEPAAGIKASYAGLFPHEFVSVLSLSERHAEPREEWRASIVSRLKEWVGEQERNIGRIADQ